MPSTLPLLKLHEDSFWQTNENEALSYGSIIHSWLLTALINDSFPLKSCLHSWFLLNSMHCHILCTTLRRAQNIITPKFTINSAWPRYLDLFALHHFATSSKHRKPKLKKFCTTKRFKSVNIYRKSIKLWYMLTT